MPDTSSSSLAPPKPRTYGAVNWLGLWTLYKREVGRFMKVWMQNAAGAGRIDSFVHDGVQTRLRQSR